MRDVGLEASGIVWLGHRLFLSSGLNDNRDESITYLSPIADWRGHMCTESVVWPGA